MVGFSYRRRAGTTRTVYIFKTIALKFPSCHSFRDFLRGMLANMNEVAISRNCPNYFVPVLWSLPFGLLVVMPQVREVVRPLCDAFMMDLFHPVNDENSEAQTARYYCEYHASNYGMYKGRPLCLDYGTYMPLEATRFQIRMNMDMLQWRLEKTLNEINQSTVENPVSKTSGTLDLDVPDLEKSASVVESTDRNVAPKMVAV